MTKALLLSFLTLSTLLQTTNLFAIDKSYDSQFTPMAGIIDRASAEMSTIKNNDLRTKNINGVRYEVIEVRDELNDIIANPEEIEETTQPKEAVVKLAPETPKVKIKNISKQKAKPIITKIVKPVIKNPVAASQTLRVLPTVTAKNSASNIENISAIVKSKPTYNKHDINGNLLNQDTEQWACVDDTETGLMWEVKSKNSLMRNSNNLYTWFNSDERLNNGIAGGGRCQGSIACDTNAYVQAMNKQNFCGHNDWKLPTRQQMQTLVYLKNNNEQVKINKTYFPETVASWYWTASENSNNNNFAWYVLFRNGVSLSDLKERPKHIRLVRNDI